MQRNVSLDVLKLSMAFMVVGLHARFLGDYSALAEFITGNGLFRIAVPVFLIINGFYFFPVLSRGAPWRWLLRVAVLYAVWMAVYSYYWFSMPPLYLAPLLKFFFDNVFLGYYHLWYLAGMLEAALLLWLLSRLRAPWLFAICLLTFALGVWIQYAGNYHWFAGSELDRVFNKLWVHRNFLLFCLPFFGIGYLIHRLQIHRRVSLRTAVIASVLGLVLLLVESLVNFYHPGNDGGLDNMLSLIIVAPAIFLVFIKQNIRASSKDLSSYATGVYLVHLFFLIQLSRHADLGFSLNTVLAIVISMLVSAVLIRINRRLRFIL